jgi:hypothetical protein
MEKENLHILMDIFTKETLFLTKQKVKVYLQVLTVQNIKVIGKIIKDKVVESLYGRMVKDTMEIG